jgi:deoxyadenosine/deoxycytidine kinase
MSSGFFLGIAGNIGAGKSTLTRILEENLRWRAYLEPTIENPYLEKYYADPKTWGFHSQVYFLTRRYEALAQLGREERYYIVDRTIYEDGEIFARSLHQQGILSEVDHHTYQRLYAILIEHLRKPDMIVYLRASPAFLLERVRQRGRDYEKRIDLDYLTRLGEAYEAWIEQVSREVQVLYVPAEEVDFLTQKTAWHWIAAALPRSVRGEGLT